MRTLLYKGRVGLVFLGIALGYMIIILRLFFLQVIQRTFYLTLGDKQCITTMTYTPPRAYIYDRNHVELAINKTYASACIFPRELHEPEKIVPFLQTHFPSAADRLFQGTHLHFMYVHRHLSESQQLNVSTAALRDLYLINEPGRYYTTPCLGPVIGITNIDQEGACGLEYQYNSRLRGTSTNSLLQRDARNNHCYFAKVTESHGSHGTPLTITIDSTLHFLAYEELTKAMRKFNASEGAVIIMNPHNGDILTLVTCPDFDPNNTHDLAIEHTKNRCVTETYEFGSVIKVFLALAALDEGVVTPETLINCYNTQEISLQGMKLSTWKAHGIIPFTEVISGSNNIGTAQVARQLGEKIYEHYRRCGFGTSTNTFWGEQAGHVTHPSTWSLQSYASLSYGYEIRATLLQLASAWCMIARRGIQVRPHIIMNDDEQPTQVRIYREETVRQLIDILEQTVQRGTAQRASIKGYKIFGKTGSANLCIDGTYRQDHSLFTFSGVVEKGDYQRVIVTYLKEAQGYKLFASTTAAPLFEAIAERMLVHDGILRQN